MPLFRRCYRLDKYRRVRGHAPVLAGVDSLLIRLPGRAGQVLAVHQRAQTILANDTYWVRFQLSHTLVSVGLVLTLPADPRPATSRLTGFSVFDVSLIHTESQE